MPTSVHDALSEIASAAHRGEIHVYGLWVRNHNHIPTRSDIIRTALGAGLRELANLDPRLAEIPAVITALACWDLTPEQWAALP